MREIKLRALYKPEQKICSVLRIDWENKTVLLKYDNKSDWSKTKEIKKISAFFDQVEFIQFTGFCDKNNKEIYEIYVAKDSYGDNFESLMRLIKWDSKLGCWMAGGIFLRADNARRFEIIGNLPENPELKKKISNRLLPPGHIMK